ncbi:enoyl-CoA hydratase/carnithine racemase [Bacillus pakistanensis]|uniref:Enoyl-CoA hydratase/carnithine racemase n=1 Tax=Rossellomorea pakistanensis TaxID=992288 RepID=A0ABS2N835_9BACI|nr:enoyl-CoA hydratase [Bacillus pakistanensis]MBM7583994.1 enoyl-CoA hydratase/carnithine racemase [Bacillus pakistanensis]
MEMVRVVSWSKTDNIAMIVINNPPVNVLNKTVIEQLCLVTDEIESDSDIKVVVVTGAGEKAFVAGGDIKGFPEWIGKGVELAKQKSLWLQEALNKIEDLPQPTIAAINGIALGGGCELAMCCDIRIAEEQVEIGLPEIKLGLLPGAGGTQRLSRLIGKAKAKEMIFTGGALSAKAAKEMGLINHVVPKGKGVTEAMKLAERICHHSFPSLYFAKRSIDEGYEQSLKKGLLTEAENFGRVFQTRDVREGVNAFIQKRKPNFLDQ